MRRSVTHIEESLCHGIKWVVFEPNDTNASTPARFIGAGVRMNRLWNRVVLAFKRLSRAQEPNPTTDLPNVIPLPDQPIGGRGDCGRQRIERAIEPYVQKARSTYPDAKARFLAGLPDGAAFLATVQLHDDAGGVEQAFVQVTKIEGGRIIGRISSHITAVTGFRLGQAYTCSEVELVDWTISNPDGTQQGNIVGRFLAEWQKAPH